MQNLLKPLESQRKQLEEDLDEAFAAYIKKKYAYSCVLTGEKRFVTLFHFFGKSMYPNTRWNEDNCFLVCRREHDRFHNGTPLVFLDWYVKTYGEEKLKKLRYIAEGKEHIYSIQEIINLTNQYIRKTQALPKVKAYNGRIL